MQHDLLRCLIVLIQNSKGGGLASGFASSNQIMGVRKTADFLEKATWTLAAAMVVLSILAAHALPKESSSSSNELPGSELLMKNNNEGLYYGGEQGNFGGEEMQVTDAEPIDEPIAE